MTDFGTSSPGEHEQRFRDWRFKDWFYHPDEKVLFKSERHGFYVRLDDKPVTLGHSLVVPLEARRFVDDLDDSRHDKLWRISKFVGNHLKEVFQQDDPSYIGALVAGRAVHHAHVHRAVCFEGRDWIGGFNRQPRLELTAGQWDDTIGKVAFSQDMARALETELDRVAAPEPLVANEKRSYYAN